MRRRGRRRTDDVAIDDGVRSWQKGRLTAVIITPAGGVPGGGRFSAGDGILESRRWRYNRCDRWRRERFWDAVRRRAGAGRDGIEILAMQCEEVWPLRI